MKTAGSLDAKYMFGEVELLTSSHLRVDSDGSLFHGIELVTEDPLFGAAVEVGPLKSGSAYRFHVSTPDLNFEYILAGTTIVWIGEVSGGRPSFLWRPEQDGMLTVTFLRHRKRAHENLAYLGRFKVRSSFDPAGQSGEFPEIAEPLRMSLRVSVSFEEVEDGSPVNFGAFRMPKLRRWKSPRIYAAAPSPTPSAVQPAPLPKPDYPTDPVSIMENHDVYLQTSPEKTLASRVALFNAFGVDTISGGGALDELIRLKKEGKADALKHITIGFRGIPDFWTMSPVMIDQLCDRVNKVTEALPDILVLMRPSEVNTNGEWQVGDKMAEYLTDKAAQGREAFWTRRVFAGEYAKVFAEIRKRLTHPERVRFVAQGDGFLPDGSDYYRDGFEFISGKNIHRHNTQMVVASARGIARAFSRKIALAYDCWNAGYYCMAYAVEVEHIFRSYYWAGCDFVDYEAQFMGAEDGVNVKLNAAGRAFYDWINFTRIHPRRGRQVIRIGFMKGSDDLGVRPTAPAGSRNLIRKRLLQSGHPALFDWDLTDIVFPGWGCYEASNHERYLTGTPYGAVDIVPWDAPADHLKTFGAIVMTGKNRMGRENLDHYVSYVRAGGTMVLALEHLLNEDQYEEKYLDGTEALIGCALGEDRLIENMDYQHLVPSRTRFFNKVTDIQGKVAETMPDGTPCVIQNPIGKGTVYFYTTEYLTTLGRKSIDSLLKRLFETNRTVKLSNDNSWIETALFQRDGIAILSLMNHGRMRCPCELGPDYGPLQTEATVRLADVEVEAEDIEVLAVKPDMSVSAVEAKVEDGVVGFNATIEKFSEFIIGSRNQTKARFFQGLSK